MMVLFMVIYNKVYLVLVVVIKVKQGMYNIAVCGNCGSM